MKNNFFPSHFRALVFLIAGLLASSAVYAQKVTLNIREGTVQQAIEMLQKSYNYSVVVRTENVDLGKRISVNASERDIRDVIGDIFAGQQISYTINDRNIVITKAVQPPVSAPSVDHVSVKGRVVDADGNPVVGATVIESTTTNGTVVDVDGNFAIRVREGSTLDVSSLGYISQSVAVGNRSNIEVRLEAEINPLEEIVVIGYGSVQKKDLTGSVSQMNMSSFEGQQASSLVDYLRGSMTGLNISRSSSVSGQSSFEIRGTTSLGSSSPLLVVDGMIYQGMLNDINPSDIETVTVLKDASSAAVYGASGAAGVLLITTKQGKSDKPVIRLDAKVGLSTVLRREEVYDVPGYLEMRGDKLRTDRVTNWDSPEFFSNPYELQNVGREDWLAYDGRSGSNWDPTAVWLERLRLNPTEMDNYYNYKNVDWLDEVLRTGIQQDYNLSVSGKSQNLNYYWSLGYLNNKGVVTGSQYQNIRSRINITSDINKFLQVGIRANLSSTNSDQQQASLSDAYDNSPLGSIYAEDGTYMRYPNEDNMAKNPLDKTQYDLLDRNVSVSGTVFAKVTLPWGFQFESSFDNRWRMKQGYTYMPSWTIDGMRDLGKADRNEYKQYEWTIENILRWNKTFGRHRFDLVLLQSAYRWQDWSTTAGASNFLTSELLGYHNLTLGDIAYSEAMDRVETKASYMARLNYSFDDRYLLTLSFRRDGYSGFGQNNPWGNFPGVAFAWRLSEENFMKGINWLDNLKIRASYGQNGNSSFDRYKSLATINNGYYVQDGAPLVTLYPTIMGNSLLQWESTSAFNVGLDLSVLRNRLNFTVDAYLSKTTNQLLDRGIPIINGFSEVAANLGQINNKGFELSVNSVNFDRKNFRWETDFAFWFNRNEIVHLYGEMEPVMNEFGEITGYKESDDPTNGWYIGHAIDEVYGYKVIGVWQEDEAAEAAGFGRVPGDYKTFTLPESTSLSSADYLWQGFTKPRYHLSMRNSFSFLDRALNLSFMLRSDLGHIKSINELNTGGYADRTSQIKYPYWTRENPSSYWGRLGASRTGNIYRDASFLRIENITLSYSLPERWISKLLLQNATISFNVDNVHSFDSWLYWDPETKNPTPTTFSFGLNLTF